MGLGHLYRCLVLYHELNKIGMSAVFLVHNMPKSLLIKFEHSGIKYICLKYNQEASEVKRILKVNKCDCIILDLMELEIDYVKKLNKDIKTLAIGGSGEGLNVVNVRIEGMINREEYGKSFMGNKYYKGPEYVILRDCFIKKRKKYLVRNDVKNILITLGGDAQAKGFDIAGIIKDLFPNYNITALVGDLAITKKYSKDIKVLKGITDPTVIMLNSDVVVSSGGMTMFELCCLGIPFILLPQTHLQEIIAISLFENKIAEYISIEKQSHKDFLTILKRKFMSFQSRNKRYMISNKLKNTIDGFGVKRVIQIIKEETTV